MKKTFLFALLALLMVVSIILAATLELWVDDLQPVSNGGLLAGQNHRLVQALTGLIVFVVLGLFGVIYKGPRR